MNTDVLHRRKFIEALLKNTRPIFQEAWSNTPGNDPARTKRLSTSNKKGFADLVTVYDKKIEEFILTEIRKNFPNEAFIGEESCTGREDAYEKMKKLDRFWIADPIDGTTNFSRAYPFFSSTLAWIEKVNGHHQVLAGATFNPVNQELFSAHRNGGAHLNGQALKVTPIDSPDRALFASGFVSLRQGEADRSFNNFVKITKQSLGVRRDGSAALDLAYVACGRIDAYWETGLSPWDMAAGTLLVEEAGGHVSSIPETPWTLFDSEIISSNGSLHQWLEEQLK